MTSVMVPYIPPLSTFHHYLSEIDKNNWYSNFGPLYHRWKDRLEDYFNQTRGKTDLKVAIFTNGTLALELALMTMAPKGSYCFLPSWTFTATASAVVRAGLIPYFLDVDPVTWQLHPHHVLQALPHIDGPVGAVVTVAPFGAPVEMFQWEIFQKTTHIPVLVDGAAGLSSVELGHIPTMISLHATKIGGVGEGGLLVSSNEDFIKRVTELSSFGFQNGSRESQTIGTNAKISEYTAAVGLSVLDHIETIISHYRYHGHIAHTILNEFPTFSLQSGFYQEWISSTLNIELNQPHAQDLENYLQKKNIQTRFWWGKGCHTHPAYEKYPKGDLFHTNKLAQRVIGLPFHVHLTNHDWGLIIHTLIYYYQQNNSYQYLPEIDDFANIITDKQFTQY